VAQEDEVSRRKKNGEVWSRCGRCRGIGTVAHSSGPAVTCPECNGKGTKKVGEVYPEISFLDMKIQPGRFYLVLDKPISLTDDFHVSVNLIPKHLPISPRTGKALALYEVDKAGKKISCFESHVSVPWRRDYLCTDDVQDLDAACPDHQHENVFTFRREILEPCEWDADDEAEAVTVHPATTTAVTRK
jgi:hypothetical protein